MRPAAHALIAAVAAALVAGACTPQGSPQPSLSGWAGAPVAELAATGLTLVGGASGGVPSAGPLVVDGTGAAWLAGPWRVVRLDPTSGEATSWDAGDDWAFASEGVVVPSAGPGVWLASRERVRLFDGTRLAADLPFPDDLLRLDDPERGYFLRDALEVGESLWVSVGYPSPESGISDARVVAGPRGGGRSSPTWVRGRVATSRWMRTGGYGPAVSTGPRARTSPAPGCGTGRGGRCPASPPRSSPSARSSATQRAVCGS